VLFCLVFLSKSLHHCRKALTPFPMATATLKPPAHIGTPDKIDPAPLRYCLYSRKSSEDDERQALSIDSQIKEMTEIAKRDGVEIEEILRESHSAKDSGQRPIFKKMIEQIEEGEFDGIITWAPDRLSRNAGDLGSLVDLMDRGKLKCIRTHGQTFTDNPNEKFLLMILCSQAKLENDNRGINVKRGQRTRAQMGYRPCLPPLGYLTERKAGESRSSTVVDSIRGPVITEMFEQVAYRGASGRTLFHWLVDEKGFRTRKDKKPSLSMLYRMLRNPFYIGKFEYPKGSGKWYRGDYEPLVNKDLFEEVQKLLDMNMSHNKSWGSKDFAFVRMMTCGSCKSGVTAEEKFKKLKNGSVKRYVYYRCTHSKDLKCKEPSIREDVLIEQLLGMLDNLDMNPSGMRMNLKEELERYSKMSDVLGLDVDIKKKLKEIDGKKYMEYVLREGSSEEKRTLLENVKNVLILESGNISTLAVPKKRSPDY